MPGACKPHRLLFRVLRWLIVCDVCVFISVASSKSFALDLCVHVEPQQRRRVFFLWSACAWYLLRRYSARPESLAPPVEPLVLIEAVVCVVCRACAMSIAQETAKQEEKRNRDVVMPDHNLYLSFNMGFIVYRDVFNSARYILQNATAWILP